MNINKYQIGKKVFGDVIGEVYLAHSGDLVNTVLVKVLHDEYANDDNLVDVFHKCAETCCFIENENQIKALEHGQQGDKHYLILSHMLLEPLESLLKKRHVLSSLETISVIEHLARILRTYHVEGMVHSILTPQNIFVDENMKNVKIADFGFEAFIRILIEKKKPALASSLHYYPPELQRKDMSSDGRSDIYSIGLLSYQMLLNEFPATLSGAHNSNGAITMIPPSILRLEIPTLFDRVILKALEPAPEDRYQNLSHFIEELTKVKEEVYANNSAFMRPQKHGDDEILLGDVEHSQDASLQTENAPVQHDPEFTQKNHGETTQRPSPIAIPDEELIGHVTTAEDGAFGEMPGVEKQGAVSGNGSGDVLTSSGQKTSPSLTAAESTTSPNQPNGIPNAMPHYGSGNDIAVQEIDQALEEGVTETNEFATTQNIHAQFKMRSIGSLIRLALVSFISLLAIALLFVMAFDSGLFERLKDSHNGSVDSEPVRTEQQSMNQESFADSPNSNGTGTGGETPLAQSQSPAGQELITHDKQEIPSPVMQSQSFEPTKRKEQPTNRPVGSSNRSLDSRRRTTSLRSQSLRPVAAGLDPAVRGQKLTISVSDGNTPLTADVYIDGKVHGKTNRQGTISLTGLDVGKAYIVKIQKSGYQMWAQEIQVRAGSQNFRITLQPLRSSGLNTPNKKTPSKPKAQPKRNRFSSLHSNSNGRTTPVSRKQTKSNADPNQSRSLSPATLDIRLTNPERLSDVFVYVNGQLWEGEGVIAPFRLNLPSGSYEIEVRKEGYRSAPPFYSITVVEGEKRGLAFHLTRN
ncbi:MAG: protein kinase [bacterium]